ncbi:methyltransferase [Streptomyces sp. NPDC096153]|uniref:methyltransferase n=1 Tax=Streptomyces sp. NPDC096153 TaxID=3155548 RepID=UPI00331D5782
MSTANDRMRRKIMGHIVSQAIHAVSQLGVPDLLAKNPVSLPELAAATGSHMDALQRFMRVLSAEGVFDEPYPDTFTLTEMGELLRTDVDGSLKNLSSLMAGEAYHAWSEAGHSLLTGKPAFDHAYGLPYFDWLAKNPEAAQNFHQGQAGLVKMRLIPLLEREWGPNDEVVDVGGGNGTLLISLLKENEGMRGIVFDLPQALDQTQQALANAGLTDRAVCLAGDFFTSVPAGADVYVLSQILHDWDDQNAASILKQCHAAMTPKSRLLILDQVLPKHDRLHPPAHPSALLDLHMLILLGGRERSEDSWNILLNECGFRVTSEIKKGPRSSLIEVAAA